MAVIDTIQIIRVLIYFVVRFHIEIGKSIIFVALSVLDGVCKYFGDENIILGLEAHYLISTFLLILGIRILKFPLF